MEKVNNPAEVNQVQECLERRPWRTPAVEEILVNETEEDAVSFGTDAGGYSGS